MKYLVMAIAVIHGGCALAAMEWNVMVNPAQELRPIKLMNAVNNGPTKARTDQTRSNFDEYKALKIPYARIHDANHCSAYGGPHIVDISAVFPDWDADETKEESYDFTLTDEYLENIRKAGTEPYYRLGQSIEHWIKKYGVNPPKDYGKWARICEHVVRHYNEGWAKGFKWNLRYWEIWNEPDGNQVTADGRPGPTWTGTEEQFLELYKVTSLHLRKCFGDTIKIGGPSFCWWGAWKEKFVPFCAKERLPLDFYSWHNYFREPYEVGENCFRARKLLDDNGFTRTESHLNEWNYVKDWSDGWIYTLECDSGRLQQKGAAAIAAVMCVCQNSPLDVLMYYDVRVISNMNALFDTRTLLPQKGYYPYVAWSRLRRLGVQVQVVLKTPEAKGRQLYAVAAKSKSGDIGLLLARFSDDANIVETRRVRVATPNGIRADGVRCHVTDSARIYSETPVFDNGDGTVTVKLQPLSYAFLEF